jgi:hypothetical protein
MIDLYLKADQSNIGAERSEEALMIFSRTGHGPLQKLEPVKMSFGINYHYVHTIQKIKL